MLDFTDDEFCYVVAADNIAKGTAMHIHRGNAGVSGPVVVTLVAPDNNGTSVACMDVAPALVKEILAFPQGFYLNIHNADFPNGAVRGQLAGHIGIGITATDATAKTAKVVLMDTENPAGAVVYDTVETQGAPVVGVDFRPGTTDAYFLLQSGPTSLVLVKSTIDGVTTTIGTVTLTTPAGNFGMDFNPVADRIRLVTEAGENLRINPDTAAVTPDTSLPAGGFAGAAYTNNFKGAATTTLYDINYADNTLYLQGGPDGTPSPNGGTVTPVGALGVDVSPLFGFDIAPAPAGVTGTALVAGRLGSNTTSSLLAVDLATGKATDLGRVGTADTDTIQAFAILS
jgi:hypothetical protein